MYVVSRDAFENISSARYNTLICFRYVDAFPEKFGVPNKLEIPVTGG